MQLFKYLATVQLTLALSFTAMAAPPVTHPQAKDKCPVCGMFVSKYPDWTATVVFKDSTALFFDGAKDLFIYYHNMQKYTPTKKQPSISAITVNDYYTLKPVDARLSYFVIGSDVYGPMGKELIPFGKAIDAQTFLKDHKGKKILKFSDVTPTVLKTLE